MQCRWLSWRWVQWTGVLGGLLLVAGGCSRAQYRLQADEEAYGLMDEKASHVARPPNIPLRIELDRRSRMFNPFDLDFQPIPLDDPASNRYMQCVDGRRGYPLWEAAGVTNAAESPDWWQFLPLGEDGVLELNAENAVRIALLHSPDYQQQLETLYLSALDVSSERFRFDTQFFGGSGANYRNDTNDNGVFDTDSSQVNLRNDGQMRRSFATGADLVVNAANSIVWNFSGSNARASSTLLDFTLLQPLLRNAGRDVVLERLTLSERRLLANVRAFERYRRGFYLNIVTGRNIDSTVRRSGGVFGVGLDGFTGLGGGFSGLGNNGGAGFGGGANVPAAGGFLGLLQDQLRIRNLEENIARLQENLLILENTLIELLTTIPDDPEAIIRQRLQIAQSRSALLGQQSALVTRRVDFQNSVDDFLGDLGLPPYICVRINDPALDRFELIDRQLRARREQLIEVRTAVGRLNVALLEQTDTRVDPVTLQPIQLLNWDEDVQGLVEQLLAAVKPLSKFVRAVVTEDLPRVEDDLKQLEEKLPERRAQIASLEKLYEEERATVCSLLGIETLDDSIFDVQPLANLGEELGESYAKLVERLEEYQDRVDQLTDAVEKYVATGPESEEPEKVAVSVRTTVLLASQDLLTELGEDVLALQLIQARSRVESLVLPEVEIDPATAFQIARVNRRDWANARANLVDTYRLIEFNADLLESDLDLTFSGQVTNTDLSNFPDTNSTSLNVGLRWDAPITRLTERNRYRQSLIDYEQAKRNYYRYEDGIWQLLRSTVRQLQANRINFELGRQSVRIAAAQIELNEDIRSFRDARGLNSGPTAARDTISALGDLLNSQNSLLDISVNFEVVRRGLELDMETMELTPEGLWIDPGPIDTAALLQLAGTSTGGMIECHHEFNHGDHPGQVPDCGIPLKKQPIGAIYGF